jgi:hypothetical protein
VQVGGVFGGVVQELGDEVGGPDHDRVGYFAGGLPPFDPFRFPHHRFGSGVGGFDQCGGVRYAADDAFYEGTVESIAQRGSDPRDRGGSGGLDAAQALASVGVGAGFGGAYFCVAGLDAVDEVFDVVWAEFIQYDVAEVRDEVYANVGFVGACGVVVDPDLVQPAGQPFGEGRYAGQRAVGTQPVSDLLEVG